MVKYLIARGADINNKNSDGSTAMDIARKKKLLNIYNFLLFQSKNIPISDQKKVSHLVDLCEKNDAISNIFISLLEKNENLIGFPKLHKTIFSIFEEIKKRSDFSDKREVTIKYERSISDEGYYLRKIVITHHNSFPNKELGLCLKEWQEKGNMGKIKEKLRGYCHWSVETIIEETPTKVNILKEKETKEYEIINCKKEDAPEGFTHILTFYYK